MSKKIKEIICPKCGKKYNIGKNRLRKEKFPSCSACGQKIDRGTIIKHALVQSL